MNIKANSCYCPVGRTHSNSGCCQTRLDIVILNERWGLNLNGNFECWATATTMIKTRISFHQRNLTLQATSHCYKNQATYNTIMHVETDPPWILLCSCPMPSCSCYSEESTCWFGHHHLYLIVRSNYNNHIHSQFTVYRNVCLSVHCYFI